MTGEGRNFKEREQEQVLCPECGKELAKGSLVAHRQKQNGVAKGALGSDGNKADESDKPRTYRLAFHAKAGPKTCPVEGCSDQASTQTAMRVNFWNQNVRDTMVILEEGNLPQLWSPLCDMLVPWKALKGTHQRTSQCNRGTERKRR